MMRTLPGHQLTNNERERLLKLVRAFGFTHNLAELPSIAAVNREERIPLSFAQQRLWFLAQMEGISEVYHISGSLRLSGSLNRAALVGALNRILHRHEALRTTFTLIDGEPMQQIASVDHSYFHLLEHDLRQQINPEEELRRLIAQEAGTSFDLEAGPLIRGRLLHLA